MKSLKYTVALFTIAVLMQSRCSDEEIAISEKSDVQTIIRAYANGEWDVTKVAAELTGDWKWKRNLCSSWNQPFSENTTVYKNFFIRFNSNNTLEIFEHSNLIHTMEWSLTKTGDTDTKPPSPIFNIATGPTDLTIPLTFDLGGEVYIANNVLVFSLLPVDGCDSFFVRE